MPLGWFGAALAVVLLGCWFAYQLVRQNGRILVRLEAIEHQLSRLPATTTAPVPTARPGLRAGTPAPPFELESLDGRRHALFEFRDRRVLIVLFDPGCGFCAALAPELAAIEAGRAKGAPTPLIVASGDAQAMRRLAAEHGLRGPILLDPERAVAGAYEAPGTPVGYLIDEQARLASDMAVGADALLGLIALRGLVRVQEPVASNGAAPANGARHDGHARAPSLANSRLVRDGLAAGTLAPPFKLPRLSGGELSLDDLRGRRVVLVFSDPHCGPCMELAPELERFARRSADPGIVIVSRGDADANRAKAEQLGLTLPIVLQRQWEISKAYGMFATPIGYRIDAEGVIESEVAVGKDAILALLAAAEPAARGRA